MLPHRSLVTFGGGAILLFLIMVLALSTLCTSTAQAQGTVEESRTSLGDVVAGGGIGGTLILALGVAIFVVTVLGAASLRREGGWPHWGALVRGLGEMAFLLGILFTVVGMISAFNEIVRLGANVTPRDMTGGLSGMLVKILLATLVAVFSLICSGALCLAKRGVED
jgi:MotA/TolQ/ExbB proton channel family